MTTYRIGFLMYQDLGHVIHDQRLRLEIAKHPDIQPEWMPIPMWADDRWQKLRIIKDEYTLMTGLRARARLRREAEPFHALYCHTQETAILLGKYMKRIPTVLSLDATPINLASLSDAYGHSGRPQLVEHVNNFLSRRALQRAAHLVTFSHWAKNSLINDYGIREQKITVKPPGVNLERWTLSEQEWLTSRQDRLPRVLFVGGNFRRKGGELLLEAAAAMQREWTVDIVTEDAIPSAAGIPNLHIHSGLRPGTSELLALYRNADIFTLPTLGDCSPWVVMEAMAMRLPVVATSVGGIPEVVVHGETGLIIPPNSAQALIEAIRELSKDPARRRAMGIAGRQRVERYYDGARSYRELVALLKSVAETGIAAKPDNSTSWSDVHGAAT